MAINFDQFWQGVRDEHAVNRRMGLIDWEMIPRDELVHGRGGSWRVDWLRFSSAQDKVIYGWVARPADHDPTEVGFLWLPGYSYGTPPPDETNLVRGAVTLCINVHGNSPDTPYVNPAGKNDYIASGIERPETYIYSSIILHCLHAMDVLGELEGVDPEKTVVAGMSQGGALALITAANHPAPKVCFGDMPFFCSVREALKVSHSQAYKELARVMQANPDRAEQYLATVSLFDPLYHAPHITTPTSLVAGGKDPASRAVTIPPVYDALASEMKQLRLFPDAGHIFLPEMVQIYVDWTDRIVMNWGRYEDV